VVAAWIAVVGVAAGIRAAVPAVAAARIAVVGVAAGAPAMVAAAPVVFGGSFAGAAAPAKAGRVYKEFS
jgi:hypothetical protein